MNRVVLSDPPATNADIPQGHGRPNLPAPQLLFGSVEFQEEQRARVGVCGGGGSDRSNRTQSIAGLPDYRIIWDNKREVACLSVVLAELSSMNGSNQVIYLAFP